MNIPSGQPLSGNLPENQELDTLTAALLGNQNMDNLGLRGIRSGQSRDRVLRNEHVQFLPHPAPLGLAGLGAATQGLGDAGIWVPPACTGIGPGAWGLRASEVDTCEAGIDPLTGLEHSPTTPKAGENGENKDWMVKKRQEMLEKNRRNQKKFRERQKVGRGVKRAMDVGNRS